MSAAYDPTSLAEPRVGDTRTVDRRRTSEIKAPSARIHAASPSGALPAARPPLLRRVAVAVFRDLQILALALCFALMVWFYVNGETTTQATVKIPVRVRCLAPDVLVLGYEPSELELALSGPKELLSGLSSADLERTVVLTEDQVKLAGGEVDKTVVLPAHDAFRLPSAVIVGGRLPPISVRLVGSAVRIVRLQTPILGEPAPGFVVDKVTLEPNEVRIKGPAQLMQRLRVIQTHPVDVTGHTAADSPISTRVDIPATVDGQPIELIETQRIGVRVSIIRKVVQQRVQLKDRTVYLSQPASFGYAVKEVEHPVVTATVEGPADGEEAARDPRAVRVYVELDEEDPATLKKHFQNLHYTLKIRGLPPGYKLVSFEVTTGDTTREITKMRISMVERAD